MAARDHDICVADRPAQPPRDRQHWKQPRMVVDCAGHLLENGRLCDRQRGGNAVACDYRREQVRAWKRFEQFGNDAL
jgi:hypothetical protein